MRKILLGFIIFYLAGSAAFADKKADIILKSVFDNADSLVTADVSLESYENDVRDGKAKETISLKKVLLKRPDKVKITVLDASALTATISAAVKVTASAGAQDVVVSGKKAALYPACLFDISAFLKDYELSVPEKDERIKRGGEEVIAIKKGQKFSYPQIRITVKAGLVREMKFYSMTGKKYYSIKINQYEKYDKVDMPVDITEQFTAKRNRITNHIKYTGVKLNRAIFDTEFQK